MYRIKAEIDLAIDLIQQRSVTPNDGQCQKIIAQRLTKLGFCARHLRFDDVDNLWITHGTGEPTFVFAGHTDVVPAGDESQWRYHPYAARIENGLLYGRGAADMKGSVAAMVCAMEDFVIKNKTHKGTLALLLTSDEEGAAVNGTKKVVDTLKCENVKMDYCLLGEPSSTDKLADTIKVGRRGSISGQLKIIGKQGHIAYPHLANNPINSAATVINLLSEIKWDEGNQYFPKTSLQFSNCHAGDGTGNVIPGATDLTFNLRYSNELDEQTIKNKVQDILNDLPIEYEISWQTFGKPFLTKNSKLIEITQQAIYKHTAQNTILSTSGGTSDGRFIAPQGVDVVELGPINATIHKTDECVSVDDLSKLRTIYLEICERLLL